MNRFSLSSITHRFTGTGSIQHDPVRDWLYLIATFAALLLLIIGWDVWLFNQIEAGETSGTPGVVTVPTFNRGTFDALSATFAARGAEQQKYIQGDYHYSDPSQ